VVTAKRLTTAIWRSNTGGDASRGFNRPLTYRGALSVADLFLYVPPRMRGGRDIFKRLSKLASSVRSRISSSY
jgi:hypothetical protein